MKSVFNMEFYSGESKSATNLPYRFARDKVWRRYSHKDMKMDLNKQRLFAMLAVSLLLTACVGQQTSIERNASHAAARIDSIHFDPNTRQLRADNIRWMKTFLTQFYEQGKADRASGLTQQQAEQRVKRFSDCENGPFAPASQRSRIASHEYSADRPEQQSQIMLQSATATYWDGYHGRP